MCLIKLLAVCLVFQVLAQFYPGGYFGYDKEGAPVFIDPVGQIDFKGVV